MAATAGKSTSQEIGGSYDKLADYHRMVWMSNLHVGYWLPEDPDAPLDVAQNNLTDILIERTPVGSGQKALDVGCGLGRPGVRLAEKTGCDVVGITISPGQVTEANHYAQERGLGEHAVFQHMDAMNMSFESESFDAAWAFESLFHMPDRAQVLRQIARVLRPGGRLVLTDTYEKVPFSAIEAKIMYEGFQVNSFISPDEYRILLETLGFEVKELVDMSENTRNSYTRIMEVASQREAELRAIYGEDFVAEMQQTGPFVETLNREKIGYFWVVAEKPSAR